MEYSPTGLRATTRRLSAPDIASPSSAFHGNLGSQLRAVRSSNLLLESLDLAVSDKLSLTDAQLEQLKALALEASAKKAASLFELTPSFIDDEIADFPTTPLEPTEHRFDDSALGYAVSEQPRQGWVSPDPTEQDFINNQLLDLALEDEIGEIGFYELAHPFNPDNCLFDTLGVPDSELQRTDDPFANFLLGYYDEDDPEQFLLIDLFQDTEKFFGYLQPNSFLSTSLFPTDRQNRNYPECPIVRMETRQEFASNPFLRSAHRSLAAICLTKFGLTCSDSEVKRSPDLSPNNASWLQPNGEAERALLLQIIKSLGLLGNLELAKNLAEIIALSLLEFDQDLAAAKFSKYQLILEKTLAHEQKEALEEEQVEEQDFNSSLFFSYEIQDALTDRNLFDTDDEDNLLLESLTQPEKLSPVSQLESHSPENSSLIARELSSQLYMMGTEYVISSPDSTCGTEMGVTLSELLVSHSSTVRGHDPASEMKKSALSPQQTSLPLEDPFVSQVVKYGQLAPALRSAEMLFATEVTAEAEKAAVMQQSQEPQTPVTRNIPELKFLAQTALDALPKEQSEAMSQALLMSKIIVQEKAQQEMVESEEDKLSVAGALEPKEQETTEPSEGWISTLAPSSMLSSVWGSVSGLTELLPTVGLSLRTTEELSQEEQQTLLNDIQEVEDGSLTILDKVTTSETVADENFTLLSENDFPDIIITQNENEITKLLEYQQYQKTTFGSLQAWWSPDVSPETDLASELKAFCEKHALTPEMYELIPQRNANGTVTKHLVHKAYIEAAKETNRLLSELKLQESLFDDSFNEEMHMELSISTMSDTPEIQDFIRENLNSSDFSSENFIAIKPKPESDKSEGRGANYFIAEFANGKNIKFSARHSGTEFRGEVLKTALQSAQYVSLRELIMSSRFTPSDASLLYAINQLSMAFSDIRDRATREMVYDAVLQLTFCGVPINKMWPKEMKKY